MAKNTKLSQDDFGVLACCAIRYCQGRQTYMPDLVRSIITPHLSEISDKDLQVIINDCEYQANLDLYGSETIDKPGWLQWKRTLIDEQNRRKEQA